MSKTAAGVSTRLASTADVEAIRRVALLTWPPTYLPLADVDYVMDGLARWWSAEAVRRGLDSGATWVAELEGQIVGVAVTGDASGERWLWKLYVLPDHHGRRVGAALMSAVLEREAGDDLYLSYLAGNDVARLFYERWGFVETGESSRSGGRAHPVMVRCA